MERREQMTFGEFINACPRDCDYQWFDLLEIAEITDAYKAAKEQSDFDAITELETKFIAANRGRTVEVYWPEHATRRGISSDCTCSFAD